jgi:hypothetical protein
MLTWKKYLKQRETLNPKMIAALRHTAAAYKKMGQTMFLSDVINLVKHGSQSYVPFISWAQQFNFLPNHPIDYILNIYAQKA